MRWADAKNTIMAERCRNIDNRYTEIARLAVSRSAKITKQLLNESVEQYLARGGRIRRLPPR
jgi:hypothetical protein